MSDPRKSKNLTADEEGTVLGEEIALNLTFKYACKDSLKYFNTFIHYIFISCDDMEQHIVSNSLNTTINVTMIAKAGIIFAVVDKVFKFFNSFRFKLLIECNYPISEIIRFHGHEYDMLFVSPEKGKLRECKLEVVELALLKKPKINLH